MSFPAATLPEPTPAALDASRALAARIRAEIDAAGGWIDFARYMELALYAPGLGYYSGGSTKLGAAGDFVTAPELTGVFGRAVAAALERALDAAGGDTILELGAGTGKLAAQILAALEARGRSDVRYRILEPAADLAARQRDALAVYGARVEWLARLPDVPFAGAIVANEVADAIPVRRFVKRADGVRPLGVALGDSGFVWREGAADPALETAVAALEERLGRPFADGYVSELRPALGAWLAALGACLERGSALLVDYGLARREYYHPDRSAGTLLCHYRHRAHADPFVHPGLTDIGAWVDFSACADGAQAAGWQVAGFTTQAQFLLAALAAEPARAAATDAASLRELAALKTLLLPGEMGERFKVLLLAKNVASAALPGRDFRDRL